MANRIQYRRDSAAAWTAANPVLAAGEPGYETDTKKRKTGDGTTAWNGLAYAPDTASLNAAFVGLVQAAKNPDLLVAGAVTLDGSDQIVSAAVAWPDGTPGTLTITARHATGAVTNYNITYGSPVTKTFTQPTITRNANGAATNIPQIVVS